MEKQRQQCVLQLEHIETNCCLFHINDACLYLELHQPSSFDA
jgi:hypothetical protein